MSRILAALCVSVLLAAPALAEGQYELTKLSPQCLVRGTENADRIWQKDEAEAARIESAGPRIFRDRASLSILAATGRAVTFGDLFIDEDDDCSLFDNAVYSFERIIRGHAVISITGYEYRGTMLVDLTSGQSHEIYADDLYLSEDNSFLIPSSIYDLMEGPELTVYDLSQPLMAAQIPKYRILNQPVVWTSPQTAEVVLYRYNTLETFQGSAFVTVTPDGISVRIEKTGEVLTAPFEPVNP